VRADTKAPRPCGKVPEQVIEVVEVIAETREEWERLPAELRCQTFEADP
jgi:hypothetical protein